MKGLVLIFQATYPITRLPSKSFPVLPLSISCVIWIILGLFILFNLLVILISMFFEM